MKAIIACAVVVMVLVPTAFATGQALDPRVPGLQRQVRALNAKVNGVQTQLSSKLDRSCVQIVPMVIRPGYMYLLSDGTIMVYKAFDEWNSAIDSTPNKIMQLADGC